MTTDVPNWPTNLLDLIRWVVADFDPLEALDLLTDNCVQSLPAIAAGVLLIDHSGELQLASSSDHSAEVLELHVLCPSLDDGFVTQVMRMLEVQQRGHQPDRQPRPAGIAHPATRNCHRRAKQV
jgi:hypothetical protein